MTRSGKYLFCLAESVSTVLGIMRPSPEALRLIKHDEYLPVPAPQLLEYPLTLAFPHLPVVNTKLFLVDIGALAAN